MGASWGLLGRSGGLPEAAFEKKTQLLAKKIKKVAVTFSSFSENAKQHCHLNRKMKTGVSWEALGIPWDELGRPWGAKSSPEPTF